MLHLLTWGFGNATFFFVTKYGYSINRLLIEHFPEPIPVSSGE